MAISTKPDISLAAKALPEALMRAIRATFGKGLPGCALVGGTALAGFYACHRTSDDIDLFTSDATSQAIAIAAIKSLATIGTQFLAEKQSPQYYHADLELSGHTFTADVVLDANIHRIGTFIKIPIGIQVPDLETLLKMKIATLVSRCAEKDLYDLVWLTENYRMPSIEEWLQLGNSVDSGLNAESMLVSLCGSIPRISACGFATSFGVPAAEVHRRVIGLRATIQMQLAELLERTPIDSQVAALVRKIKKAKT